MTELPEGFFFDDVYCYQNAASDRWTFSYIPGKPKPALNHAKKPIISLLVSDRGAILQLQTRWDVHSELLTELQQEVTRRNPKLESDLISLEFAQVYNPEVTLLIGDGQSSLQELETRKTSGSPPIPLSLTCR